jgi:hypothetical protein
MDDLEAAALAILDRSQVTLIPTAGICKIATLGRHQFNNSRANLY